MTASFNYDQYLQTEQHDLSKPFPGKVKNAHAIFFNRLDQETAALLLAVQDNVLLFKGQYFYKYDRPSVRKHTITLVDEFLAFEEMQKLMNRRDSTATGIVRGILGHEYTENSLEVETSKQKMNPALDHSQTKPFERNVALLSYEIAACHAVKNTPQQFLDDWKNLQDKYAYFDNESCARENNPPEYARFMKEHLALAETDIRAMRDKVRQEVTFEQGMDVSKNLHYMRSLLDEIETDKGLETSVIGNVVKSFDKNCPLYVRHDYDDIKKPDEWKIESETSHLYRKTAAKMIKYLPWLSQRAGKDSLNKTYYDVCVTNAYGNLMNYTDRHRPVIALSTKADLDELPVGTNGRDMAEFNAAKEMMLKQRRDNGTHALADPLFMSKRELKAKIDTYKELKRPPDTSFLTNMNNIGQLQNYDVFFKKAFNAKLEALSQA